MACFSITVGRVALAAGALLWLRFETALAAQPTPPPSHGKVYGHGSGLVAVDVDYETGADNATPYRACHVPDQRTQTLILKD